MPLGRCGDDDDFVCSPNQESCVDSVGKPFEEASEDTSCVVETTRFGSCGGSCFFSPTDCVSSDSDHEWIFPDDTCSCDNVKVGACMYTDIEAVFLCCR